MEKDVMFTNSKGYKLHGVLTTPSSKKFSLVIICHGYASSTESTTREILSQKLLENNIASFGFDFTGCGASEGELYELTLSQGLDDLNVAYDYVKNSGVEKIGLLGSSFSGSVAILFSATNKVEVVVLKSPVSDYSEIKEVPLVARNKQQQFFDDAAKYDIYSAAEKISVPLLIVHGDKDVDVPVQQSVKLFSKLNCEKKFEVIKGADHRYSDEKHFSELIVFFVEWIGRYLNSNT